jgi:hypothetical protein
MLLIITVNIMLMKKQIQLIITVDVPFIDVALIMMSLLCP